MSIDDEVPIRRDCVEADGMLCRLWSNARQTGLQELGDRLHIGVVKLTIDEQRIGDDVATGMLGDFEDLAVE